MLLALLPLVLAPFLIRDPLVDLVQLSRGLLLDDAAGEPQHVETGQRGIVVHLGVLCRRRLTCAIEVKVAWFTKAVIVGWASNGRWRGHQ
ncbi:hypothetical protein ABT288_48835 [Streptomyces sp. NPDC001093]|uniref:hypothetical protein n=1 Tax=Streptomyces sp. NPDC001093 TaxID=3154376 RepID=UPI0033182E7D